MLIQNSPLLDIVFHSKDKKERVFHTIPNTRKVDIIFLVMGIATEIHLCALHMINISVGFILP